MAEINLPPFEVGQSVELRSFESGYRGAWFQCKILKIFKKGRSLYYNVEYLDYPGEDIHTTKVFQQREGGSEKYLMIRPVFPRKFHESEVLNEEGSRGEAIVVHDSWKVGDLVDWWEDYCYWSGTVLEVRDNDSLQIELLAPPYGEGSIYEALSKDVRPSLEWSLDDGWTVPFSKDGEKRQCAKLVKHVNEGQVGGAESMGEEMQRPSDEVSAAESMEEEKQRPPDEVSVAESREEKNQRSTEKMESNDDLPLNIMESESVVAAVMDLEELIVRFGWLKGRLAPNSSEKTSWVYEDYRPSSSRM
ncbi:hypothetical protein CARUB_v10026857mg [Capsella rubella]|uniref:Agenet domain-containing protein n=1 Tax=Capsella rubella TaxID=81985 RepID=R0GN42_9BRAS|nr:uncharacterized protein LOC17876672 [Capsella rubella]XP_023640227.1 uncharacterized protein LOC17876672 [Capsella rubella]EOA13765.1 hypothetical protein CARUB_v10026857mg [Capsella rubella]